MRIWQLLLAPLAGGMLLAACGEATVVEQVTTQSPLAVPTVSVIRTGDADVTIPVGGVSFRLDGARLLVVEVRLSTSTPAPRTVEVLATLYDSTGRIVGNASGGAIRVVAGPDITVELSGPTPSGTISAVTLEVHTVTSPPGTPPAAQ